MHRLIASCGKIKVRYAVEQALLQTLRVLSVGLT